MTERLSPTDRTALVNYRLARAEETLAEAAYNAQGEFYNTAVNRLYYAAFYAASALILANGIEANTHAGVKTMLALHFIKAGKLEPTYGRIFLTLFENRQSGDYEDFVYCDIDLYNSLRPQAESFVKRISEMILPSEQG